MSHNYTLSSQWTQKMLLKLLTVVMLNMWQYSQIELPPCELCMGQDTQDNLLCSLFGVRILLDMPQVYFTQQSRIMLF